MNSTLNHIHIQTNDLEGMSRFFEQALDLIKGERPPFNFAGLWLWNDDNPIIHLTKSHFEQNISNHSGTGIVDHIAFNGSEYDNLIARLERHGLDYVGRQVPGTMARQVFIQGPEGLAVEIVFEH